MLTFDLLSTCLRNTGMWQRERESAELGCRRHVPSPGVCFLLVALHQLGRWGVGGGATGQVGEFNVCAEHQGS